MMIWIYAAAACVTIAGYWLFCRKNAIKHQQKAAELIEQYLADEALPEKEKMKMYTNYHLMRSWFALPGMLLMGPLFIVIALASGKFKADSIVSDNSKEFSEVYDSLMKMYVAKNPITSAAVMSVMGLFFALSFVVGIVLNKVIKFPSYAAISSAMLAKYLSFRARRHAH
ncbi:hypothetical protein [Kluyvera intermedia]|uniref:hypothetical protein n=1 Tax=Kluyvera intermedia TaxID=61648 RepID=UPI003525DA69